MLYTEQSQTALRTWARDTAPPVAQQEVVISENGTTVRGQLGGGGIDARTATILAAWGVALGIGIYYGTRSYTPPPTPSTAP